MTGGLDKEHGTNKPPPTGRVRERLEGDATCLTFSQNPSHWYPSWLSNACSIKEGLWVRTTGQRQPKNWSHHCKIQDCEARDRAVLLGSLTLLLSAWAPFPNKSSCFVNSCVSSDSSFPSVIQEPTLGPWKGPLSCHISSFHWLWVVFFCYNTTGRVYHFPGFCKLC